MLQGLNCRVMAAGLIADRDGNAGQIGGVLYERVGGYENAGRGYRVGVAIELAVTVGGGDVHRPVAGATDVGLAAFLKALVGTELGAQVVLLGVLGA